MEESPMPLHYQITQELKGQLENGHWQAGDLFPTDKQLMEKYQVSSTTVRRAIYELVKEGWLVRKPGKGTYVRDRMVETLQRLTGFFEEVRSKGMEPSAQILNNKEIAVDKELLELIPELSDFGNVKKLYMVEKVQNMNGKPVVLVQSFWPIQVGREFAKHNLAKKGMYEIIQSQLNLELDEAVQIISAAVANEAQAKALQIAVGDPILKMNRIAYKNKQPLEVSVNYYRHDRYCYRVVLSRNEIKAREGMIIKTK